MKISKTKLKINSIEIGDKFCAPNKSLLEFYAPNLEIIGHNFLFSNKSLCKLLLPKLKRGGYSFLYYNTTQRLRYQKFLFKYPKN